jgi:putative DNA primase/helicase
MSLHRPRFGDFTFPGRPFSLRPGTQSPDTCHAPMVTAPANPVTDTHTAEPQPPEPESIAPLPAPPPGSTAVTDRQADLVCLSDIEDRPVDWLWQDRLASGTLAMLSGDPGSGKTWVALAIAAALSRGRVPSNPVPFTADTREPYNILYASAGNEAAELVRPRFAKLDGDPARLVLLRGVVSAGSTQSTSLSLRDTPMLEDALERTLARLLIIDPLHSYLWAVDRHRANESGRAFDNLARLAEKHRCCILLVRHLRKRGAGQASIELSSAIRTEFLAGSSPDAPTRPALVQVKSNLGPLAPSLGYTMDQTGGFSWTGTSKLTPEELMTDRPIAAGLPRRKLVAEWLRQNLLEGKRSQYNIETAAQRDGVCITTLRRAKFDLGVLSTKESVSGSWYWALPQNGQPPNQPET